MFCTGIFWVFCISPQLNILCTSSVKPNYAETRNTFCGTFVLLHRQVHNERTVPIITAGCTAHARNGHTSTSALKTYVTIVFLDPDFLADAEISRSTAAPASQSTVVQTHQVTKQHQELRLEHPNLSGNIKKRLAQLQ